MNATIAISIIALCCAECSGADESESKANLLPALRPYVKEVVGELDKVSAERKVVLNEIVASIIRTPRREYGPTAMAPNNVSPATAIPSNRMML